MAGTKAFMFDVYGTVCDWFSALRDEAARLASEHEVELDAGQFARDWRNGYARATYALASRAIETGASAWVPLVQLTREVLDELVAERIGAVASERLDEANGAWRRFRAWPDVHAGLQALKSIGPVATCSNGNFDDMRALSLFAGLDWDFILGAEHAGFYKPHPETYLRSVEALDAQPADVVMVASHQGDLAQASRLGLRTAFVMRPLEFGGPGHGEELEVTGEWDFVAEDFVDLARRARAL